MKDRKENHGDYELLHFSSLYTSQWCYRLRELSHSMSALIKPVTYKTIWITALFAVAIHLAFGE